jgi:hypothetical protein
VKLFLWKLSQDENNDYETYDSAVVVATDPMSASRIHPAQYSDTGEAIFRFDKVDDCWRRIDGDHIMDGGWARPNDIKVTCIGEASSWLGPGAIICSSYNAG